MLPGVAGCAPIEVDVYLPPRRSPWATVIALHGMALRAERDPRLIAACRALADVGLAVVAPRIPTLAALELSTATAAEISASIQAIADDPGLGRTRRVGVFAASIAAGQALAAAALPPGRERVGSMLLIGAYAEAGALLDHLLCVPSADPYGRMILLRRFLAGPDADEPWLSEPLDAALADDSLSRDPPLLPRILAGLQDTQRERFHALCHDPGTGSSLAASLRDRHQDTLDRLSVAQALQDVRAPVTLIHGRHDTVIPASESLRIQAELQRAGRRCGLCTTALLDHGSVGASPRALLELPSLIRTFAGWFGHLRAMSPR